MKIGAFLYPGWMVWLREAGAGAADVQDGWYVYGRQEPEQPLF